MNNCEDQDGNLDFDAPVPLYFSQQNFHSLLDNQPNYGPIHHSLHASNLPPLIANPPEGEFEWAHNNQEQRGPHSINYLSEFEWIRSQNEQDPDRHHLQKAAQDWVAGFMHNASISSEKSESSGNFIDPYWSEPENPEIDKEETKPESKSTRSFPFQRRKLKPLTKSTKTIVIPNPALQPPDVQNEKPVISGNTTEPSQQNEEFKDQDSIGSGSREAEEDDMDQVVVYKHPAMAQFWNKIQKKYAPKKATNKNLTNDTLLSYAKDELSKKILRHLTSYDRGKIKWPRSVKGNKSKQFEYIKKYFKKEYGLQPEMFDMILAKEEAYIITLFCSIGTRNSKQVEVAKKLLSEPSVVEKSRPGRRKASNANQKLLSKTSQKNKPRTLDRCNLLTGSKLSVTKLFKTYFGKLIYYEPFCTLWSEFVDSRMGHSTEEANNFRQYLQEIKRAVESDEQN